MRVERERENEKRKGKGEEEKKRKEKKRKKRAGFARCVRGGVVAWVVSLSSPKI